MTNDQIEAVIKKVKEESGYKKCIKKDLIYQLINMFGTYEIRSYSNKIENPLEIALQFYKDYNYEYYKMILKGIKNKTIIIEKGSVKSYTEGNRTFIKLCGNDSDLFIIVHELAHFIDRNSTPMIVPNRFNILSEVFPFYLEKKLELWLTDKKYEELKNARRNNRFYFETRMLRAIKSELYYEELYKENGTINKSDISIEEISFILPYYKIPNLINYLLRYPLANILSDYLIHDEWMQFDDELVDICTNLNLHSLFEEYFKKMNRTESQKRKKFTLFSSTD